MFNEPQVQHTAAELAACLRDLQPQRKPGS
jgi:hypothetical protein